MKSLFSLSSALFLVLSTGVFAASFTPGNIVVTRVGSPGGTLGSGTAAPVFLDEFTPAGTLVQSIALPTSAAGANAPLTAQGTSTTEAIVTRSENGRYLAVAGYAVAPATTGLPGTPATVNRVVGLIDAAGQIDTTTKLSDAFSGSSVRSAATSDGNQFWLTGGNDGVRSVPFGNPAGAASTVVSSTVTNLRVAGVFGGQLYFSTASGSTRGIYQVGNGLPTGTGNASTSLINVGGTASPSQFVLLDLNAGVAGLDTGYLVVDATVRKFTFDGATWTAAGSASSSNGNVTGVAAQVNGSVVTLFATTAPTTTSSNFVKATDPVGGTLSGAFTSLVASAAGTAFRGVALAPESGSTTTSPTGSGLAAPNTLNLGEQTLLTVTVTPGSNPASTGLGVTANLSAIGGAAAQAFFDNASNGDVAAGDGVFSLNVTPATGAGPVSLPATVSDAEGRSTSTSITLTLATSSGITRIHSIQGETNAPLSGTYKVEGIVTAGFAGLGGFFLQEESADYDANPLTSEGIFVFSNAAVQIGQKVQVEGAISNQYNLTNFPSGATVTVQAGGALFPLPPEEQPVFPFAAGSTDYLERFEGMRVTIPGPLHVTDNYNLERYGELFLSPLTAIFNPTEILDPNDAPAAGTSSTGTGNVPAITTQQSLHNRYRVMLDDGRNVENGNPIPYLRTSAVGGGRTLRLGDSTTHLSGILSYDFSEWRIQPTVAVTFAGTNEREATPPNVSGNVKVAGSNVLNYFITFGGADDRGADNATEFSRQKTKIVAGLKALNAGIVGLSELQNNGTGSGSAFHDLVKSATGLNAAMTAAGLPTYEIIATPSTPFGSDAIQVGFIYQPAIVTPAGVALTDTANFSTYSRPPLAQLFSVNATGGKFWVIVNHFKSKGASGATGADVDQNDGQGAYNFRRKNQATALINFITTTLAPSDPDVLVIGDLNAYGQEDPIDLFRAAGLIDLIAAANASEPPYSYLFDGQLGRLDHALATPSLAAQLTGAIEWHVNADEPRAIDYDLSFKTDDQYVANLYRFSDHDPILVGFDIPAAALLLTPNYGRPGTTVVINGASLGSASLVRFEGNATAAFTINSSSQITVTVPAAAQTGPIQVTAGVGVLGTDTFRLLPKITAFAPASGPVGTEVIITGTDLLPVTAVKFGNNLSTPFIIDSNTQLRATVPAGAVRGNIRVETPGGPATSLQRFTVTP